MSEPSLDDRLKLAQIDKAQAESRKLVREADAAPRQLRAAFWSEAIKIVGGVVLGIGGIVSAVTQYQVAEYKSTIARMELREAENVKAAAIAAANDAVARRDAAIREREDAERAIQELKTALTRTTSAMRAATPELVKSRLAYIQFRGDLSRGVVDDLRQALLESAFSAPGAERVAGEYQNIVKYFSQQDAADAERLARAVEAFFTSRGCPLAMRVVPAGAPTGPTPPLEVWLAHSCK